MIKKYNTLKEYRKAHRERSKEYYDNNKEQVLAKRKAYYEKNKEQILARLKEKREKKKLEEKKLNNDRN